MPYKRLTRLIETHFDALSAELQKAARWVREHPAELGLQSLRQSAASAGVSPASMSRLARALGLSSFEEMRRPSIQALAQTMGMDIAPEVPSDPGLGSLNEMNACQVGNASSVYQRNQRSDFDAAAKLIVEADQVVFLGLRASFAIVFHMQYTCDWLREGTHLASNPGGAWPERVLSMGPRDVLVVVSQAPYTRQVVAMTQEIAERGVKIVALTDSELSPLARLAAVSLLFSTASPSFFHSQTGALVLAEALMNCVSERSPQISRQRLAMRQETLQRMGAYWERPTPMGPKAAKVGSGLAKANSRRKS